jgi:3-hydroxyisobutyrate dehydrogenase
MVDAPVSGAKFKAKDGTLAIMAGGDLEDFARVLPVLQKLGNQIFHVGPLGAGHAVKALNNYLGAAGTLAGFEALLIAQAFGLDPALMLDAINASTGRNSTTARKIPQDVLTGAFNSGFKLALMTKDVGIAAELATGLKVDAPFLKETLKHWRAAQKKLPPDADHTEIYKYQRRLGLRPRRG